MKANEQKQQYIKMRADGCSYRKIAQELGISKSTCQRWEKELAEDIAELKCNQLNELYDEFYMKKEARIKELGATLSKIDNALGNVDMATIPPEKLLDFKLKYMEALQKEYISTAPAYRIKDDVDATDIVNAYGDLLNRVRAGEVTGEQASKESVILANLLKAYDIVEVKSKLDEIETILGSR